MRKNTHQRVYYYAYKGGFSIYTAKPKRKNTMPERVTEIGLVRTAIRKKIAREQALIDRLFTAAKENESRAYEEHKKLVERQVERIQDMYRLRTPYPKLW